MATASATNHGDIGAGAIDLSTQTASSTSTGARGDYSLAAGQNTIASGNYSVALGENTNATGNSATTWGLFTEATGAAASAWGLSTEATDAYATAWGRDTQATGNSATTWGLFTEATVTAATAWGRDTQATGEFATAWGRSSTASGSYSSAFGRNTQATNDYATAWGFNTGATQNLATAWGNNTKATGGGATAWGESAIASASYSTAFGDNTGAESYGQTTIGTYNTTQTGNATFFVPSDRLLVVGNGTGIGAAQRSDALVILKDGTTTLNGALTINTTSTTASYTLPVGGGNNGQVLSMLDANSGTTTWTSISGGVFTTNANTLISTVGTTTHDFIIGSDQIDNITGGDDDARLYFDKSKAAFRAGHASGTTWNVANVGDHSAAFGFNTEASGDRSTAFGNAIEALSYAEIAMGSYNTTTTPLNKTSWNANDRLFVLGNGNSSANRSDALVILKDGTTTLNGALTINTSSTTASYTLPVGGGSNGQVLSMLDATTGTTTWTTTARGELQRVTESGNTGYRLALEPAANHGDIGDEAIDLSIQIAASASTGARGNYSFAAGRNTTASGIHSFAFGDGIQAIANHSTAWGRDTSASNFDATAWGRETNATGQRSTAWGDNTTAAALLATAWGDSTAATANYTTAWGRSSIASASYSTAFGEEITAESYGQTSLGLYNTPHPGTPNATASVAGDRLLVVGNGTSPSARSDALVILKNGTTTLNGALTINTTSTTASYTLPVGGGTNGQVLSMLDVNSGTTTWTNIASAITGLVSVTEGGDTGFRLANSNAANHGDIGTAAVDISFQGIANSTSGATGNISFASGEGTTASGHYSSAFGRSTIASGLYSSAFGRLSTARGDYSIAMTNEALAHGNYSLALGHSTVADSYGQISLGIFNTLLSGTAGSIIPTDRLLVVGNGTNASNRSDALVILKDGTTTLNGALTINTTSTTASYTLPVGGGSNGQVLSMLDATTGTTTWTTAADATTGLVSVTEGSNSGYRLALEPEANHGDIGNQAVDLSIQTTTSTTTGARGDFSTAMGRNTTASGNYSTAMGDSSTASGTYSTAMGRNSTASGFYSTAIGRSTASGVYSVAIGENNTASGDNSTAMGRSTVASGDFSTAMGHQSTASGYLSTAMGRSTASGFYSTAIGESNTASGIYSTAIGRETTAESYGQVSLGIFNTPLAGNATGITATDRLLVVGNGTSAGPSDALVMLKNGNTTLNGALTINHPSSTSSYTLPITKGTAGQVLSIDNATTGTTTWTNITSAITGLVSVTESGNTGYRFANADASRHGDIGDDAVDLSIQEAVVSISEGATGDSSFAGGQDTSATGDYSTAFGFVTHADSYGQTSIGHFNTASPGNLNAVVPTDRLFVIGNGANLASTSDALVMLKNGNTTLNGALTINHPSSTSSYTLPITKGTAGQVLSIDNATTGTTTWTNIASAITGLVSVTENGNTGYRLANAPENNHGDIGDDAIDLSIQDALSTTRGATGQYAFATGRRTTASGDYSITMGRETTASGDWSTAMGFDTTASGNYSTAMGRNTTAESYGQTTIGYFNTAHPGTPFTSGIVFGDRLFVIGNGVSSSSRSDAMVILKNGNVGIGDSTPTEGTLVVSGTIVSSGSITANSTLTPDYVFESYFKGTSEANPDYNFPSLAEVEAFVKENHHLPNVPSATEVEAQGGIVLNRASEVQLEKIEELYLHTIEQQKQLGAQQEQLEAQQKEIETLKAMIKDLMEKKQKFNSPFRQAQCP